MGHAFIEWRDDFSVNVKEIDEQHKRLLGMINGLCKLHNAMKAGKARATWSALLDEMTDYMQTHFTTEEAYMKRFNFPGYEQHCREHQDFVRKVLEFRKKYEEDGLLLSLEAMEYLEKWLVEHIQGTDKQYTLCLNMNGII